VPGAAELAGITQRMSQRFVRLSDLFQMRGQAVDELHCGVCA
jgi:hypothetical protein